MNNNNNINVLFVNSRRFYLSHPHLRPPPTSHHVVLTQMLLAFIQLKFQGQNVSSFETYRKAIWVATVSPILYCFAYEAELRLPAYSRVIRRGMIVLGSVSSVSLTSIRFPGNERRVLSVVCPVFGKRVGSDSPLIPNGVELDLSENHWLSSATMEAANRTYREQERPASTASVRNESYGGLRVVSLFCYALFCYSPVLWNWLSELLYLCMQC